jgi:osmotically-inducible protein OsmY
MTQNIQRLSVITAAVLLSLAAGCASDAPSPREEPVGEQAGDALITSKVKTAIYNDPVLQATEINVETHKGVVQLSGFVSTRDAELRAAEIARGVAGVRAVNNDMRLKWSTP